MSIFKNKLIDTIFFIILATGITLFILIQRNNKVGFRVFSQSPPVFATPVPTTIPVGAIQTEKVPSPDGKSVITMKKQKIGDIVEYSFYTSSKSDISEKLVYSWKETLLKSLSIPYNTWSPAANTYFFLKESTPTLTNYYVFYASGKSFPAGNQFINIRPLFTQKVTGYSLVDVTGWADPNLLIVNTKTDKGEERSFWFDVPSQSFIQLSVNFY